MNDNTLSASDNGGEQQRHQTRSLASLQGGANTPNITPSFGSLAAYELMQRQAKLLTSSTLVPENFRSYVVKLNRDGTIKEQYENPNGLANCVIALNMALRMNADPIMVMQNLILVEGRPSWSAQWVIAQINNCGRFEPLRFDMIELGSKTVTMEFTEWADGANGRRVPNRKTKDVEVEDIECTAWTVQKGVVIPLGVNSIAEAKAKGLPIIKGPKVSVGMAVKEGWYTKPGSKWQTMPDLMLHYRSGAFFGRIHAPELLMGIPTTEEREDMRAAQLLHPGADGTYEPTAAPPPATVHELRPESAGAAANAEGAPRASTAPAQASGESATVEPATGNANAAPQEQQQPQGEQQQNTGAEGNHPKGPAASDDMFGSTD